MLSRSEMQIAMAEVRDAMIKVIERQERESHEGKPCSGNRASAIAYMAHSIGVRHSCWDLAGVLLDQYDAACNDRNCRHETPMPTNPSPYDEGDALEDPPEDPRECLLYPQYEWVTPGWADLLKEHREWLAAEATRLLAEYPESYCQVIAHWQHLARV